MSDSSQRPPKVCMRASGNLACFSRPEFSVERASYPWITPSSARSLFEAVLWKPRIRYEVREIRVLRAIRFTSFRRNEIGTKIPSRGLTPDKWIATDEERQQRNTLALSDVDYVLSAELFLNDAVQPDGADDNHGKYVAMFERRLERGQHFHHPYLGCREFAADLRPPVGDEAPIPVSLDQGLMLYDFLYPDWPDKRRGWQEKKAPQPLYFHARLEGGVVAVPARDDVLARRGAPR